jgi:hypothetical protein
MAEYQRIELDGWICRSQTSFAKVSTPGYAGKIEIEIPYDCVKVTPTGEMDVTYFLTFPIDTIPFEARAIRGLRELLKADNFI